MKIHSNLSSTDKIHDGIKYESIEKQVYTWLNTAVDELNYQFMNDGVLFYGTYWSCKLMIKNGLIWITFKEPIGHDLKINETKFLIKPNKHVEDRWQQIKDRIYELYNGFKFFETLEIKYKDSEITDELSNHFRKDNMKIAFLTRRYSTRLSFFFYLDGCAMVDGILFKWEDGRLVIDKEDSIDNLFGSIYKGEVYAKMLEDKLKFLKWIHRIKDSFNLAEMPKFKQRLSECDKMINWMTKYNIEVQY